MLNHPAIQKLEFESPINVQTAVDVIAVVPLNEDRDLQYEYGWSASGGEIKHNGVWDTDSIPETQSKKGTDRKKKGKKGKKEKKVDNTPSLTAMGYLYSPRKTRHLYHYPQGVYKVCSRRKVKKRGGDRLYHKDFSPCLLGIRWRRAVFHLLVQRGSNPARSYLTAI